MNRDGSTEKIGAEHIGSDNLYLFVKVILINISQTFLKHFTHIPGVVYGHKLNQNKNGYNKELPI